MSLKIAGGIIMENNDINELFNSDKLNESIKIGKRKSILKVVIISLTIALLVFFGGQYLNTVITVKINENAYSYHRMLVELGVPNGYISMSYDNLGLLGGYSIYEVSRSIGDREVILEDNYYTFGKEQVIVRGRGQIGGHSAGEWPDNYWENGYKKMMFFHPEIAYKEYKDDFASIEQIPDGKLIEMAISFDKAYTYQDIYNVLPNSNISWIWIDAYTEEDFNNYKQAVENPNATPRSNFIFENDVIGLSFINSKYYGEASIAEFNYKYNELLTMLQKSKDNKYNEAYHTLSEKNYTDASSVPVLGVIVYGTKDELKELANNPNIKASSFGVIIDNY